MEASQDEVVVLASRWQQSDDVQMDSPHERKHLCLEKGYLESFFTFFLLFSFKLNLF